jgi:GDP-4-dehydro-6-deoxy-D-mannose reductase
MPNVLLTGAGGFSGRAMARLLEQEGMTVHSIGAKPLPRQHHHQLDITSIEDIASVLREVQPAFVFHLAGVVRSAAVQDFYCVNTQFAVALLAALEQEGFKIPTLLVGTAAEVGQPRPEQLPIREDMPAAPLEHYGISKLAQTHVALAAWKRAGIPVVVARPSNIIGAGMPKHFVVQSFASQIASMMRGELPLVLKTGNLNSERDFISIDEVVKAYWQLVNTPAAHGEVVNVCAGVATPIKAIVSKLAHLSGLRIVVETDPALMRPVDVPVHYGSTEKFQHLLGYAPQTNLDEVLGEVLRAS